jgi:hypothetical protein
MIAEIIENERKLAGRQRAVFIRQRRKNNTGMLLKLFSLLFFVGEKT